MNSLAKIKFLRHSTYKMARTDLTVEFTAKQIVFSIELNKFGLLVPVHTFQLESPQHYLLRFMLFESVCLWYFMIMTFMTMKRFLPIFLFNLSCKRIVIMMMIMPLKSLMGCCFPCSHGVECSLTDWTF